MREEQLQRSVAAYLDRALPKGAVWWHTPNGRGRTKGEAGKLKADGVKPGVADCLIVYRGKVIGIELKVERNGLSEAQKAWRDALLAAGGHYAVARSLSEVEDILGAFEMKLRVRL